MMIPSTSALVILLVIATALISVDGIDNTVFLIRHGEKPADGGNGLSHIGELRAACLVDIFSDRRIDYIMAQKPRPNGSGIRSLLTVEPLAKDLGLEVDTNCDRDEPKCVANIVRAFSLNNPSSNILISWQHTMLTNISEELGVPHNAVKCRGKDYDLIWAIRDTNLVSIESQECPGLDVGRPNGETTFVERLLVNF